MFALQDSKGRKVVVKDNTGKSLVAVVGTEEFLVKEATIVRFGGAAVNDASVLIPDREFFDKKFEDAGFQKDIYLFDTTLCNRVVSVQMDKGYQDYQSSLYSYSSARARDKTCRINNKEVTQEIYDKLKVVITDCDSYDWLTVGYMHLQSWSQDRDVGNVNLSPQKTLELIGEGQIVTVDSLVKACAKGETRPRLWLGDSVEVKMARKTVLGTITGIANKVSVLRSDGKKGSHVYSRVYRTEKVAFNEDAIKELDPTLTANFAYVLKQAQRVYKAELTIRESVTFPAFPGPNDNEYNMSKVTNAATCDCPLCGWPMADFDKCNEFKCCMCRVRGIIAHQDDKTVTLLMLRQPAKNQFAIREAKCCGNCGLFKFQYGCQGKRSTGYCEATNQCVQAHSTCVSADGTEGYWFPRTSKSYSKNMTQHITNMGYGVSDKRNTGRQDIRDTVYNADDHKAQRVRADKARTSYAAAYAKFMSDLAALSKRRVSASNKLTDKQKKELQEHYQQVLNAGC